MLLRPQRRGPRRVRLRRILSSGFLTHQRPFLGRRGAVYGPPSFRRSSSGSVAMFTPIP
jgi:hypothetical protein